MSETIVKKQKASDILALILAGQQDITARLAKVEGGAIVKGDDGKSVTLQGKPGQESMTLKGQSKGSLMSELVAFVPQGSHVIGEYPNKRSGKIITNISRGFNTPSLTLATNGQVDLLGLGLVLRSRKEELLSDVAMMEGVERWLASKVASMEAPKA